MNIPKVRKPVVAGQFYPSTSRRIKEQISSFLGGSVKKEKVLACMLPHAGYMYSGRVASQTVSQIDIPDKVILLGPNHTGEGSSFSIMTEGIWQTPLGDIKIDSHLANDLLQNIKYLNSDDLAHAYEHSLEVQLPILQYFRSGLEIVPISFLSKNIDALKDVGEGIARVIKESNDLDSILIVASSDMTHYEPQNEAERKDKQAIEAILELDADRLAERVSSLNISMCGYAPVIVMLSAVKHLGAKSARLVKYQTSGDVTGDKESVVGYAGIIIS